MNEINHINRINESAAQSTREASPPAMGVGAEPVAWCVANPHGSEPPVLIYGNGAALKPGDKLYAAPCKPVDAAPADLSDEQIYEIAFSHGLRAGPALRKSEIYSFARALLAGVEGAKK